MVQVQHCTYGVDDGCGFILQAGKWSSLLGQNTFSVSRAVIQTTLDGTASCAFSTCRR